MIIWIISSFFSVKHFYLQKVLHRFFADAAFVLGNAQMFKKQDFHLQTPFRW